MTCSVTSRNEPSTTDTDMPGSGPEWADIRAEVRVAADPAGAGTTWTLTPSKTSLVKHSAEDAEAHRDSATSMMPSEWEAEDANAPPRAREEHFKDLPFGICAEIIVFSMRFSPNQAILAQAPYAEAQLGQL